MKPYPSEGPRPLNPIHGPINPGLVRPIPVLHDAIEEQDVAHVQVVNCWFTDAVEERAAVVAGHIYPLVLAFLHEETLVLAQGEVHVVPASVPSAPFEADVFRERCRKRPLDEAFFYAHTDGIVHIDPLRDDHGHGRLQI